MPIGSKLTDGTHTGHYSLCISHCPFVNPLPSEPPFQFTVSDGGNTLTDQYDVEWIWDAGDLRYERADGASWVFWDVFNPGGGFIQRCPGGWGSQSHGEYQKNA